MRYVLFSFCFLFAIASSAQEPAFKKSIYFGGGSYYIGGYQRAELHNWLDSIPNLENYQITIHSHTDNIGGVEFNEWLSENRSQAAIQELILKNINTGLIEIRDFGLHNPLYDNSTSEGRMMNRRVDIILWPLAL